MPRPLTMKKDGIQTRNRKLSAKSKKKRGSVVDFFAPFDSRSFSAYGSMAAHMGGGGASSYLANPMSQYYGMTSGFMGGSSMMYPTVTGSNPAAGGAGLGGSTGASMSPTSSAYMEKNCKFVIFLFIKEF